MKSKELVSFCLYRYPSKTSMGFYFSSTSPKSFVLQNNSDFFPAEKSGVNTQDRRPQSTRQTQKIQRTQVPPTRATIRDGEIGASLSTDAAYVTTKSVTASTMGVSGTETGTTGRGKGTVAPGTSTSANSSLLPTASLVEAVEESTPVEPVQRSVTDDGVPGHTDTKVESHPTVETKGTTSKATNHEGEHSSSVHLVQLEEQIPKNDVHCADGENIKLLFLVFHRLGLIRGKYSLNKKFPFDQTCFLK